MRTSAREELLAVARSLVGALLLGVPLLYTMETWWLGWRLPAWLMLAYSLGGLAFISLVAHVSGYRRRERHDEPPFLRELRAFARLFATSLVAGVLVLLLLGIPEDGAGAADLLRLTLLQIVPLGLGASLTNLLLEGAEEDDEDVGFLKEAGTFAAGALFFALPIAPTEEMELIAAHAGPGRIALLIVTSLVLTYLTLYVLRFRGHRGRLAGAASALEQAGETAAGYAIAFLVAAGLLAGFGHFLDVTLSEAVQETAALAFVGCLGGAAGRVVI